MPLICRCFSVTRPSVHRFQAGVDLFALMTQTAAMSQKIALITGASRGFGAAVAAALAANGTHVIALARTVGGLEELDDRISAAGGTATLVPLDITDEGGLQRLCLSIHERWGHLDILVHCAFFAGPLSPVDHMPEQDWDKNVAVNIRATQRIIAMTAPLLLAAKSAVAVLPDDPKDGDRFMGAYGSCKAAQRALMDSWRCESAKTTVSVLSFTPKPMPTALRARFFPGEDRTSLSSTQSQAARLLKSIS